MVGAPLLEDAVELAVKWHRGQKDKAGEPYILHPLRVMLDPTLQTEEERIVAIFHDVLEDCGVSEARIRYYGFSETIIAALKCLTRREGEEYMSYIDRVANGSAIARRVKIADLKDNADLSRFTDPTEKDFERAEKYRSALAYLGVREPKKEYGVLRPAWSDGGADAII